MGLPRHPRALDTRFLWLTSPVAAKLPPTSSEEFPWGFLNVKSRCQQLLINHCRTGTSLMSTNRTPTGLAASRHWHLSHVFNHHQFLAVTCYHRKAKIAPIRRDREVRTNLGSGLKNQFILSRWQIDEAQLLPKPVLRPIIDPLIRRCVTSGITYLLDYPGNFPLQTLAYAKALLPLANPQNRAIVRQAIPARL